MVSSLGTNLTGTTEAIYEDKNEQMPEKEKKPIVSVHFVIKLQLLDSTQVLNSRFGAERSNRNALHQMQNSKWHSLDFWNLLSALTMPLISEYGKEDVPYDLPPKESARSSVFLWPDSDMPSVRV